MTQAHDPADPSLQEPARLTLAPGVAVARSALRFSFDRSSGPGGQNVNKVATRATLRIEIATLRGAMPADAVARLIALAGDRVNKAGELVLHDESTRSQRRNREACVERLAQLVAQAMVRPRPRHATRVPRSQRRKRLENKRIRGATKRGRDAPPGDG